MSYPRQNQQSESSKSPIGALIFLIEKIPGGKICRNKMDIIVYIFCLFPLALIGTIVIGLFILMTIDFVIKFLKGNERRK